MSSRFVPTNPCARGILKLCLDEKTSDVVFDVGGQSFHAHRLILQTCAPGLADCCGDDGQGMTSVPITGEDPTIFRHVLHYVYGGKVPDKAFREHSKDIIDAADRFGIGNLKVEAEGWYVELTPITMDNFTDNLYLSDTKKCALLKERVMDFLIENEVEALDKISEQDVPQSETMLTDFLTASARKKRRISSNGSDFKTMSINDMREKLDKRGLDVDGTRHMLATTLEECGGAGRAVVAGAGVPEINGIYKRSGSSDGVPKYSKIGRCDGRDVEFCLYRCKMVDGTQRWYLSIVPTDRPPGSTKDIDFYATGGHLSDTPPNDNWIPIPNRGALPSPIVSVDQTP